MHFCLYFPFHTCLTAPPSIGSQSNMPIDSLLFPCVLVKCVWLFGRCIFLIYANCHLSFMSIFLCLSLHTVGLFLAPGLLLCSHLVSSSSSLSMSSTPQGWAPRTPQTSHRHTQHRDGHPRMCYLIDLGRLKEGMYTQQQDCWSDMNRADRETLKFFCTCW